MLSAQASQSMQRSIQCLNEYERNNVCLILTSSAFMRVQCTGFDQGWSRIISTSLTSLLTPLKSMCKTSSLRSIMFPALCQWAGEWRASIHHQFWELHGLQLAYESAPLHRHAKELVEVVLWERTAEDVWNWVLLCNGSLQLESEHGRSFLGGASSTSRWSSGAGREPQGTRE